MADAPRKYRPSNGTEGHAFIDHWCGRCRRDTAFRSDPIRGCPIVANALAYRFDEPDYPAEWQYGPDGRPRCTAFEAAAGIG